MYFSCSRYVFVFYGTDGITDISTRRRFLQYFSELISETDNSVFFNIINNYLNFPYSFIIIIYPEDGKYLWRIMDEQSNHLMDASSYHEYLKIQRETSEINKKLNINEEF